LPTFDVALATPDLLEVITLLPLRTFIVLEVEGAALANACLVAAAPARPADACIAIPAAFARPPVRTAP